MAGVVGRVQASQCRVLRHIFAGDAQAQGAVASRAQADPRSCWGLGAKDWGSCWCQWAVPILRLDCPTRLSGNRLILAGVAPDN